MAFHEKTREGRVENQFGPFTHQHRGIEAIDSDEMSCRSEQQAGEQRHCPEQRPRRQCKLYQYRPEIRYDRAVSQSLIEPHQRPKPHEQEMWNDFRELNQVRMHGIRLLAVFEILITLDDAHEMEVRNFQSLRRFNQHLVERASRLLDCQQVHRRAVLGVIKEDAGIESFRALPQSH